MAQHTPSHAPAPNFFDQQQAMSQVPFLPEMLQNPAVARMLLAGVLGGRTGRSQQPSPPPETSLQQVPGSIGTLGALPPQFIQALLGGQSGRNIPT